MKSKAATASSTSTTRVRIRVRPRVVLRDVLDSSHPVSIRYHVVTRLDDLSRAFLVTPHHTTHLQRIVTQQSQLKYFTVLHHPQYPLVCNDYLQHLWGYRSTGVNSSTLLSVNTHTTHTPLNTRAQPSLSLSATDPSRPTVTCTCTTRRAPLTDQSSRPITAQRMTTHTHSRDADGQCAESRIESNRVQVQVQRWHLN